MQKIVMKLAMKDDKKRAKALQTAVGLHGVVSATVEADKIVVVGDVDSVTLTMVLRKKMGHVDLVSVTEEKEKKEDKKDEKKEEKTTLEPWLSHYPVMHHPYPIMIHEDPYYHREPAGCIIL